MTVWFGIVLAFIVILLLSLLLCVLYLMYWATLLAEAAGIEIPMFEKQRLKRRENALREKKDAEFTQMLEDLSLKKKDTEFQNKSDYVFDELDQIDEEINRQKETDPDALLTLLEFGLPDEEFEDALTAVEDDR